MKRPCRSFGQFRATPREHGLKQLGEMQRLNPLAIGTLEKFAQAEGFQYPPLPVQGEQLAQFLFSLKKCCDLLRNDSRLRPSIGDRPKLRAQQFNLAVVDRKRACRPVCEGFQSGELVRRCRRTQSPKQIFGHSGRLDGPKPIKRSERFRYPIPDARKMLDGDLQRRSVQDRPDPAAIELELRDFG